MHSFCYRNQRREDPFVSARRNINHRLDFAIEKILKRFRSREERELMRRTLTQLIRGEDSFQGKIDKLMKVAGEIEIMDFSAEDWLQTQASLKQQKHHQNYGKVYILDSTPPKRQQQNQSTQYSFLNPNPKQSPSRLNTVSNQFSSYKQSFTRKDGRDSPYHSMVGFDKREDRIQEGEIFSFRTQEDVSPGRGNKMSGSLDGGSSYARGGGKSPGRSIQYSSRERSEKMKKSKSPLRCSNSQKKLKKSKGMSPSPKKINYDGSSFLYLRQHDKNSKKNPSKKNKKNTLPTQLQTKLYKKILKRISLSNCVVDKISHSTPTQNDLYISNRHKHEKESRTQLIQQIQSKMTNKSRWS